MRYVLLFLPAVLLAACFGDWTDAATRIAYDLEAAAGRLGPSNGDRLTVEHRTPSAPDQCTGPYTVQFDEVGALIVWCKDASGETVSSHSTTYHRNFVATPRTWILEKAAGEDLLIDLERRGSRIVITGAR